MRHHCNVLLKWFAVTGISLFGLSMAVDIRASQSLPDIGMVIRLTGSVAYWHADGESDARPVQSFMKIRKDDHFRLSPHAVVQLVYFPNGRKETWTGPGDFMVGDSRSHALGDMNSAGGPQVLSLPSAVVDEVKRVSPLVDPSRLHRSGGAQVRGSNRGGDSVPLRSVKLTDQEKGEIDRAKEIYSLLQNKVDNGDIIPELYLFSVLADYDQFKEMQDLIAIMRRKQPNNAGIDRLEQWLQELGM